MIISLGFCESLVKNKWQLYFAYIQSLLTAYIFFEVDLKELELEILKRPGGNVGFSYTPI